MGEISSCFVVQSVCRMRSDYDIHFRVHCVLARWRPPLAARQLRVTALIKRVGRWRFSCRSFELLAESLVNVMTGWRCTRDFYELVVGLAWNAF
jgi:hypothetical protein